MFETNINCCIDIIFIQLLFNYYASPHNICVCLGHIIVYILFTYFAKYINIYIYTVSNSGFMHKVKMDIANDRVFFIFLILNN